MNDTVPTHEMIKNLAEYIVNGMSFQELTQHVYDDVYSIMLEDRVSFLANAQFIKFNLWDLDSKAKNTLISTFS